MTEDTFRDIALHFDGAIEGSHMGHPDFRASGRVFASLHGNGVSGMVSLAPAQQTEVQRIYPSVFEPASGAWGRQGYTKVLLAAATVPAVRTAMLLAYQGAMEKPKARPRSRRT